MRRRDGADSHLLDNIPGEFTLLTMKNGAVPPLPEGVRHICIGDDIADSEGVFAQRFDATPSAAFLLRPDQHLVRALASRRRRQGRRGARPRAWKTCMSKLQTQSQFADPDAAYIALVEARRGLSEQAAAALDTRLVLILANHIGDLDVLKEAIALAKAGERS